MKEKVSMKKVVYGVCTLITFAYCFLFATSVTMLIVPLVFLHASTYLSLIIDFNHQKRGFSFIHSIFFVLFTALICGAIDFKFEYFALDQDINWLKSLASLFVVTPLFMHFYLDALIWKGKLKFQRF